jgi:hypothetical protein
LVRLRRPHLRATPAAFGLERLATVFMNRLCRRSIMGHLGSRIGALLQLGQSCICPFLTN